MMSSVLDKIILPAKVYKRWWQTRRKRNVCVF